MRPHDTQTTIVGSWDDPPPDGQPLIDAEGGARYAVIEEVGRGGMGRVLRAYDPALQREVALKEVHEEGLDPASKARMVSEARAMAKVSHPNVVAVYDVEVGEAVHGPGGVRIVMEFVAGQTLREWIEGDRTWAEAIEVFILAGQGLAAAHGQGLIHRDFKPSNVLVGPGSPPVVKVTDFGIAKSSASEETDSPKQTSARGGSGTLTRAGTVVGTPRYMAPEQHAGKTLTSAADQFAFCVALWEALTGRPPFTGPTLGQDKWQGPPDWRTVTRQTGPGDAVPVRTFAHEVPRRISAAVERGLAPRAADRWPSMDALLAELAPPDPAPRRMLFIGGALVLSVGIGAAAWATSHSTPDRCAGARDQIAGVWGPTRSAEVEAAMLAIDRPYASEAWQRVEQRLDGYSDDWVAMHTEACEATSIRREQSSHVLDLRMSCLGQAKLQLEATVDVLATADEQAVSNSHSMLDDLPELERCADIDALLTRGDPPDADDRQAVDAAAAFLARARAQEIAGQYEASLESVAQAEKAFGDAAHPPTQAEILFMRGSVEAELGRFDASVEHLEQAQPLAIAGNRTSLLGQIALREIFVLATRLHKPDQAERLVPLATGIAAADSELETDLHSILGGLRGSQGDYEQAVVEFEKALALASKREGPSSFAVAVQHSNLGMTFRRQGDFARSEAELRQALALKEAALGARHPSVANSLQALGTVLHRLARYDEAEQCYRDALELRRESLPERHPHIGNSLNALGIVHKSRGEYDDAERYLREAEEIARESLGGDHPQVADTMANLGNVLRRTGKLEEAESLQREALEIKKRVLGSEHPSTADSYNNLAIVLRARGKLEESEQMQREALAVKTEALGPDHPSTADSHGNLGNVLAQMGRLEESREHHEACLEIRLEKYGDGTYKVAAARSDFAELALALEDDVLALELSDKAWGFFEESEDSDPTERAQSGLLRAKALWAAGQRDEATQVVGRARSLAKDAGTAGDETLERIDAWIAER